MHDFIWRKEHIFNRNPKEWTPFNEDTQYLIKQISEHYEWAISQYDGDFGYTANYNSMEILFGFSEENIELMLYTLEVQFPKLKFESIKRDDYYNPRDYKANCFGYVSRFRLVYRFTEIEKKTCECGKEFYSNRRSCKKCLEHKNCRCRCNSY